MKKWIPVVIATAILVASLAHRGPAVQTRPKARRSMPQREVEAMQTPDAKSAEPGVEEALDQLVSADFESRVAALQRLAMLSGEGVSETQRRLVRAEMRREVDPRLEGLAGAVLVLYGGSGLDDFGF